MRAKWRTVAVRSAAGPTMKPGVSHRNSTGSSNASHSCRKRAALSAPSASIAPPRWVGSLATTPERAAVHARERGHHPRRRSRRAARAPSPRRTASSTTRAHLVDALALLGDQLAQQRLVGARAPALGGPREVGEVALGQRRRPRVVGDAQVDDAVGVLHVDRADLRGLVDAEAAALDHRRAAHADARVLGRDHDVAAAEQRGVAREAVAGGDARRAARGR